MTADPAAALEVLRQRFVLRCADDLAWLEAHGADPGSREALGFVVHRLAGTGGVFGYVALSAIAAEVEIALEAPAAVPELGLLLAEIRAMLG